MKSIDGKLSIRLDPICICGMILYVADQEPNTSAEYTLVVHCDNDKCTENHINKTIVIILE